MNKMIPDFQSAMLLFFQRLKMKKNYDSTMIRIIIVEHFGITGEEKQVKTLNGKQRPCQKIYVNCKV